MTTDRELLELAAKAINCTLTFEDGGGGYVVPYLYGEEPGDEIGEWSPLTDDGDALRLAVYLRIDLLLCLYKNHVLAKTYIGAGRGIPLQGEYTRPINDHKESIGVDAYSATRRAIVRAAAEIGRNMK